MTVGDQLRTLVSGNALNLAFMAVSFLVTGYGAAVASSGSPGGSFTGLFVLGLLASIYSVGSASRTAQRNAGLSSGSPDLGRQYAGRAGLLLAVLFALCVGATSVVGLAARSLDLVMLAETVRFSQAVSMAPLLTMFVPVSVGYLLRRRERRTSP